MRRLWLAVAASAAILGAAPSASAEGYGFDELVYLTCEEAWVKAGESKDETVAMIGVLAEFSMEKRALTVPEGENDLSDEFGELIKAFCVAEPEGLLYNAVDKALRRLL